MNVIKFKGFDSGNAAVAIPHEEPIPEQIAPEPQPAPEATTAEPAPEPTPSVPPAPGFVFGLIKVAYLLVSIAVHAVFIALRTVWKYLSHHPVHAVLNVAFLLILALLVMTGSEFHKQAILAKISDQTVEDIIRGSRFTRNYDSEEVARDGVREFLGVGAPEWAQREAVRAVLFHARKAGLSIEDQAVLLATVDVESGFNPMARAPTTTACGLFQFIKRTGEAFSLSTADCMNPWLNAKAGVEHYMYNYDRRVRNSVEELTGSERVFRTFELSYYLHHDGPDSSNPANDVKATILSGTQFLFRAYHALLQEAESEQRAPSFAETFTTNFLHVLDTVASFFSDSQFPFMRKLGALRSGDDGLPEMNKAT